MITHLENIFHLSSLNTTNKYTKLHVVNNTIVGCAAQKEKWISMRVCLLVCALEEIFFRSFFFFVEQIKSGNATIERKAR